MSWFKLWECMDDDLNNPMDLEGRTLDKFSGLMGGPGSRFSPPSFKSLRERLGSLDERTHAQMSPAERNCDPSRDEKLQKEAKRAVEILSNLVEWVERKGDTCQTSEFRKALIDTNQNLNLHDLKVELDEFRLTVFVQLVVLSGVAKKGCKVLTRSCPVENRGSFKTLQDCRTDMRNVDSALHQLSQELGLSQFRADIAECICCEARQERANVVDVMFQNQDSFHPMWDHSTGCHRACVKRCNTDRWVPAVVCKLRHQT